MRLHCRIAFVWRHSADCLLLTALQVTTAKMEKTLDHTKAAWEEIKKLQPNVKADVEPIQGNEAERIKNEIGEYASKLRSFRSAFRKREFYQYATGPEAAYPQMDGAAKEIAEVAKECKHFEGLAAVFEFSQLMEPILADLKQTQADLVMVKDVWDTSVLCEVQFADWKKTLWNDIRTDLMEDGAKNFVKEVKSLNKLVRDEDVFKGVDNSVKNFLVSVPLVADLRSPAMRDRHWQQLMDTTKVSIDVKNPSFSLSDLLALELHKFEEEVGEIVDR